MRILHLSTSDIDNGGARAAYRLHQGLRSLGCSSQMLVRARFSTDPTVVPEKSILTKLGPVTSQLSLQFFSQKPLSMFSPQYFPDALAPKVNQIHPDIINLHWVCNGFLRIETLAKFQQPLVWTLHDMWPFTGGCHYNSDCDHYQQACGTCPQLGSDRKGDLSHRIWQRKAKSWKNLNLTIVATTSWMADCARSSSLFKNRRIEVIPLGLDTDKYKPCKQSFARDVLNLPHDKQLVLFGAIGGTSDRRKGFHLLLPALQRLKQAGWEEQIELVLFGSAMPEQPPDLGFRTHYVGRLTDDITLALVYSAVDVMIVPSIQEAFGQTASEAMACGTPVVAFNATGLKDVVNHQQTGYLATPFEPEDLAKGIAWVLSDKERHQMLAENARNKALQEFTYDVQARRYLSLYQTIAASC